MRPPEIGHANAAGGNGGKGEDLKGKQMIPRTAPRPKPPLHPTCILFHTLEAVNAAHDAAHDGGNEDRATGLLAHRNVIVQQIVGTAGTGGAR